MFSHFQTCSVISSHIESFTDRFNLFRDFQPLAVISNYFQKCLLTLTSLSGLLGSDEEDMLNQICITILTSFIGVLGTDREGMKKQNGILTLTSFNGLLGFDEEEMLNQNGILTLTSLNGLLGLDAKTTYDAWITWFSQLLWLCPWGWLSWITQVFAIH